MRSNVVVLSPCSRKFGLYLPYMAFDQSAEHQHQHRLPAQRTIGQLGLYQDKGSYLELFDSVSAIHLVWRIY